MGSKPFSMSKVEWQQYGIDFAIAVSAFASGWLTDTLLPAIDQTSTTGLVVALGVTAIARFVRSWAPSTK